MGETFQIGMTIFAYVTAAIALGVGLASVVFGLGVVAAMVSSATAFTLGSCGTYVLFKTV